MKYGERLKYARNRKGWSQGKLAEESGVGQGSISKIERGDQDRSSFDITLAKALEINPEWLANGTGSMEISSTHATMVNEEPTLYINTEPGPDIIGRVPLISWVQAGAWAEVIDNHLPGQADEWRLTTAKVSKNSFALRVKGDSMTNPHGSPSVPDGYIIIVDPNKQAENGDLVVARLDDSMEVTFKKLVFDGSKRYLKPLNPAYPVIEINGNCTICGKVVKVELDL